MLEKHFSREMSFISIGFLIVCNALTIQDLAINAAQCAVLSSTPGATIPCQCRVNTGLLQNPVPCFPNCCPKTSTFEGDWCDIENQLQWSVYDQQVCIEAPPAMYIDSTVNCFGMATAPFITGVDKSSGVTQLQFELSALMPCFDLYITSCFWSRDPGSVTDFFVNTTDTPPRQCLLDCAPQPIEPCTAVSCWAHRGNTAPVVKSWTLTRQLDPGDYALVCKSLISANAVTSTLYQWAAVASYFRVN